MTHRSLFSLLCLAIAVVFLSLTSVAHADNPLFEDARTELKAALNPGGDAPSVAERTKLLKSALESIRKVPAGGYRGHRKNAITFIQEALDVLGKGDKDGKAANIIREALDEVRDMTD